MVHKSRGVRKMSKTPLAEELRPQTLKEVAGQDHLLSSDSLLCRLIQEKKPLSLLLFGPPGSGKTTLARLYAKALDAHFLSFRSCPKTKGSSISEVILTNFRFFFRR